MPVTAIYPVQPSVVAVAVFAVLALRLTLAVAVEASQGALTFSP